MIDLENLEDLYTFQVVSKENKNFQVLFNRDLARKLYEIELTGKDFDDLKKRFTEGGKLGKDPNFYRLMIKIEAPKIYSGLLLDCRYEGAVLDLRNYDIKRLNSNTTKDNIIYQSYNVKKDEQEKMLKDLFLNYLNFVSKFIK